MLPHPIARLRSTAALTGLVLAGCLSAGSPVSVAPQNSEEDAAARARWVTETLGRMTVAEKVGQLVVPGALTDYLASDTEEFARLVMLVEQYGVGGIHVFGGRQPVPRVLLGPGYNGVTLGEPLAAASLLNRLQRRATVPLLNTADFETGAGFRLAGATVFPRPMALGAANDELVAYEVGRITAIETRAVGVHVNFAPVVDVNNNPRNPVINTRSFGEDPERVGALGAAYVRGLQDGGVLATLKHFPGHGDTDVDTHLGLATITHSRDRLDAVELPPFQLGLAAGAAAVMTGHIVLPGIDPGADQPATLSRPVIDGLLREDLGFDGLVYTDSMSMDAVARLLPPGEAAVRAIEAGNDIVLHSPNDVAALEALGAAVTAGRLTEARLDVSVARVLGAKARLGLTEDGTVDLERIPELVGTAAHRAVAEEAMQRAITLITNARGDVPLAVPRDANVLYLSLLDYPRGWASGAPSRVFQPELAARWPATTAVELTDRSPSAEIDLVRAMASRYDAIVASVFVRAASGSGRMDLAPGLVELLERLTAITADRRIPFVVVSFGNPYVATFLPSLPAVLLTYDFRDVAELAAVRAVAGEAPIGGRLPVALPGRYPVGHGLDVPAVVPTTP